MLEQLVGGGGHTARKCEWSGEKGKPECKWTYGSCTKAMSKFRDSSHLVQAADLMTFTWTILRLEAAQAGVDKAGEECEGGTGRGGEEESRVGFIDRGGNLVLGRVSHAVELGVGGDREGVCHRTRPDGPYLVI